MTWEVAHDRINDEIQVGSNSEPGSSKFISFSLLIDKLSCFQWLIIAILMKVNLVVKEKKKVAIINYLLRADSNNSDSDSKSRPLKFISFLLLFN